MSKRLKIILALVAGAVVLALTGGAIVMAADPPAATTPVAPSNALFAKVAATLGFTEKQLTDAMKLAGTQIENQRVDQALAQAVTNKTLTQDEATAIKAWLAVKPTTGAKDTLKTWEANKPKIANSAGLKGLPMFLGKMMGPIGGSINNNTELLTRVAAILTPIKPTTLAQIQAAFSQAEQQMKAAAFDKLLADAVTNKKITQSEADQIKAWWGQKPAAVDKLMPKGVPGIPGSGMTRGGPRMVHPGFKTPRQGTVPVIPPKTTPPVTN